MSSGRTKGELLGPTWARPVGILSSPSTGLGSSRRLRLLTRQCLLDHFLAGRGKLQEVHIGCAGGNGAE